jgi:hypothetical protein
MVNTVWFITFDPLFIDMTMSGFGEVPMDLEVVSETRPCRRLGCPSFEGFERKNEMTCVSDFKGLERRNMRVSSPSPGAGGR